MFESRISEKGNLELVWTFGAFESITGYTPDEFIAIGGFRATIHPEDITIDEKDLEKLQRNQNVVTELRTLTKYGKIVWIRVYAQPICCLLYTSDAADERSSVDLGGRRIIKKKNKKKTCT